MDMKKYMLRIPILLISITLILSGIRWMTSDEPWMLDQVANEERLNMSFEDLLSFDENSTFFIILPTQKLTFFIVFSRENARARGAIFLFFYS